MSLSRSVKRNCNIKTSKHILDIKDIQRNPLDRDISIRFNYDVEQILIVVNNHVAHKDTVDFCMLMYQASR